MDKKLPIEQETICWNRPLNENGPLEIDPPFDHSKFGIPQGLILRPLLFHLYVNDLKSAWSLVDLIMFLHDVISLYTHEYMDSPLHKKWSFPLRVSSVNVIKSAVSCEFGHIYWRNPKWKTSFFVQWKTFILVLL